jgi:hypothetical protein
MRSLSQTSKCGNLHHLQLIYEGRREMKRFALVSGVLVISSIVAVPLYFWRKLRLEREQNRRYDISDYLADESL